MLTLPVSASLIKLCVQVEETFKVHLSFSQSTGDTCRNAAFEVNISFAFLT